jgi:thermostable 8-oxoguanine DNA glycosylase
MHSSGRSSTQRVLAYRNGELVDLMLPAAKRCVFGHDLLWGCVEEIGTPAYWTAQAWMWELEEPEHYRLGRSLREEVLACILGGHGIPAEVGLAAYARLREAPAADLHDEHIVRALLTEPLLVRGRSVRYRFFQQKARHVASCMDGLDQIDPEAPDRDLRDALIHLRGIGPKTASWIVRNWRGSDHVSILDVHIVRACRALGIFEPSWRVERHYALMEQAYLAFATAVGARASILDSVIWMTMRRLPSSIVGAMGSNIPRAINRDRSGPVDTKQIILL